MNNIETFIKLKGFIEKNENYDTKRKKKQIFNSRNLGLSGISIRKK